MNGFSVHQDDLSNEAIARIHTVHLDGSEGPTFEVPVKGRHGEPDLDLANLIDRELLYRLFLNDRGVS